MFTSHIYCQIDVVHQYNLMNESFRWCPLLVKQHLEWVFKEDLTVQSLLWA
jgi:hypothetical protein